MLNLPRVTGS